MSDNEFCEALCVQCDLPCGAESHTHDLAAVTPVGIVPIGAIHFQCVAYRAYGLDAHDSRKARAAISN